MLKKILKFKTAKKIINFYKKNNKKIGLCHGVFDLLHLGHIRHFKEAKKKVDILIVSVTEDKYVNKGPGRPAFNELQRMESLAALEFIDYVILSRSTSAVNIINLIKPDIFFKGPDYQDNTTDLTGKIYKERNAVIKNLGKIYYTDDKKFSSTKLLRSDHDKLSDKQIATLKNISKKTNFSQIKRLIDDLRAVKPLVLGETILDEYHFTETLGKSGKEPVLVLKENFYEKYLGGAGAICNHISKFVNNLNFISYIGKNNDYINFIKKNISKNVKFFFIKKDNSPTILKKRYVDEVSKAKILGAYSLNDSFLNNNQEIILKKNFNKLSLHSDFLIISDYGHGLISKNFARYVCSKFRFVSVNVQINSSNLGYHSLENYIGASCVIINENELRYELRSKIEKIEILAKILTKKLKLKYLIITRGTSGAILYQAKKNKFYYSDAFGKNIVDKVGAGDAMLSIISLCLFKKIDLDLSLLIASLCSGQAVSIIGNKYSIKKEILLRELEYYLS
jgi:rfaE bifunctional protein kinase chain/domain/rfaE bifunctional protein nucleotidyltransferase chain/domain